MGMQHAKETLNEIRAYARKRGQRPTHAQIRRYQQNGLIAKPKQVPLGRGKGTETRYAPGTGAQLVAACKAAKSKSFRIARWRLWWERWPLEASWIRSDLLAQAEASKKKTSLPRKVRRRLRLGETPRFQQMATQSFAGKLPGNLSGVDERILAKGFGLDQSRVTEMRRANFWPVPGFGKIMEMISAAISPKAIKSALANATDEDLHAARDEVRAVIANLDGLSALIESAGIPVFLKEIPRDLARLSIVEQQTIVSDWLSARQAPTARGVYYAILQLCIEPHRIGKRKV